MEGGKGIEKRGNGGWEAPSSNKLSSMCNLNLRHKNCIRVPDQECIVYR